MKKKSLAAVISTVLAMSLVTGCGGTNSMAPTKASASEQGGSAGENESPKESGGAGESKTSDAGNVTPAGEFPIVKEPITLKVAAIDETYVGGPGRRGFLQMV